MEKKCIGIDVGGTTVKIGLFETDGTLVYKWEVPSRKGENGAYILPDVAASIRKKLNERGIPMDAVIGAGMGFPGPVQPDGYVEVCVNLGWRDLNPQKILSELLDGMPVRSGNDANVAALGEMWQGGGKGCHDIVMVTLGTGVGGGVVHDQKIVAGRHGLGGEIGHIHIREGEKETCNCGGHGCLEQVASATGIAREARRKMVAKPDASVMRAYGDAVAKKKTIRYRILHIRKVARHDVPSAGGYGHRVLLSRMGAGDYFDDRGSGDFCHRRRRVKGGDFFNGLD